MNEVLVSKVLEKLQGFGIREIVVCPGGRNAPFVIALAHSHAFTLHYWFEERSAAFYALGRSRALSAPVCVLTTSGTAVGELLPATMEAYYSGVPLLLLTADRPKRLRGTGAPQAVTQPEIFGVYAPTACDIDDGESCEIPEWDRCAPFHLNVCFEDPKPTARR